MSFDLERIAADRADFEARHGGITTRLYRSRNGMRIHTPDCKYACIPWIWAEDETDEDIAHIKWLFPCGHCKPYVKAVR